MGVPLKYAQIRYFAQSSAFQPLPVVGAEKIIGAPAFHKQWAAALFNVLLYEKLNATAPAYAEQARRESLLPESEAMRLQVEKAVDEFVRVKRLVPLPKQEEAQATGSAQPQQSAPKPPEPVLAGTGPQGQQGQQGKQGRK